ncbi:hypothetical protein BG000_009093 [Podila horticola]|nr:hypothetical protein BG000_009093 [Podila horticola]
MSQALEAESNQYRQQQLGHLSSSRMLSVGLGSNKAHNYYRRRGKLGFDKLPREIKVHVFRYLTTFQLIRVSRVSRAWRNIALDGSLWKAIDTTRYYKTIQDDQLLNLGVSASGFLRYVNFRVLSSKYNSGCAQLSSDSLSTIAEHCPNVERLDLTGCRKLSSKALADVCMNMTSLIHLDLASLSAVNNYTLQAMAVYCRSLRVLNLAWCRHITGAGLSKLTKSCQELQKLNVSGCSGMEDRWMPTMGMNLPRLKELCLNGCQSLTDRGLIGLLSGLSVGLTKKYRKRRNLRRLSSSIRVATLGEDPLLMSHSSSCLDDNDYDEDDEDSFDDLDKGAESDNEASDLDDDEDEEGATEGAHGSVHLGSAQSAPLAHQEGLQTRLRYLGLSHCSQLTQEALRAIGHHCSRHLRRLEMSGCENFGDEGLIYLAQHCSGLRLLDLEDDSLLTDASLRAFGMHLPHLERICLSYCENITDQGVLRMLKPLTVNPNTPINMAVNPDKFCSKLAHLELDNCLLVTDRLLLEFANVLEDRRIKAIEKQREKERKQEERRERIRQKKKKPLCGSEHQDEDEDNVEKDRRHKHGRSESSLRSLVEIVQNSMPSTSYHTVYPSPIEERRPAFISSAPVNIPTAPYRYHPALAAAATASTSSFSSSPSPLQPRGVLASTSVSEEMAIKKAGQKPILRIITPTRSTSTSSTTSLTSSSSLPLWPSALQSRRAMPPRPRVKKPQPPTIQVFDCRNISLEGVEAAQKKCESLVIKSYYSWTNPRTPTAVSTTRALRSYSSTSSSFGATLSSSGYFGSSYGGIEFGEEEDEDEDEDGTEDDEEAASAGNSHSCLHQLQLQHQQHQQYPQRARSLFHRARLGLMGQGRDRGHQCHIL